MPRWVDPDYSFVLVNQHRVPEPFFVLLTSFVNGIITHFHRLHLRFPREQFALKKSLWLERLRMLCCHPTRVTNSTRAAMRAEMTPMATALDAAEAEAGNNTRAAKEARAERWVIQISNGHPVIVVLLFNPR